MSSLRLIESLAIELQASIMLHSEKLSESASNSLIGKVTHLVKTISDLCDQDQSAQINKEDFKVLDIDANIEAFKSGKFAQYIDPSTAAKREEKQSEYLSRCLPTFKNGQWKQAFDAIAAKYRYQLGEDNPYKYMPELRHVAYRPGLDQFPELLAYRDRILIEFDLSAGKTGFGGQPISETEGGSYFMEDL
jgi:hypothetical protein